LRSGFFNAFNRDTTNSALHDAPPVSVAILLLMGQRAKEKGKRKGGEAKTVQKSSLRFRDRHPSLDSLRSIYLDLGFDALFF
jgi:hypothetical protein